MSRLICLDCRVPLDLHNKSTPCASGPSRAAVLTHSVHILKSSDAWPSGSGTYETTFASFGAPSLDAAEEDAAEHIAHFAEVIPRPYRATYHLFCRRCFAGDLRDSKHLEASDACPACGGTLLEPLYAPAWPEELAVQLAAINRIRLDREAVEEAQRKELERQEDD